MFRAFTQPIPLSDLVQIYAWRLMLQATRLTQRVTLRWAPIVLPVVPWLWVPVLALFLGAVTGFFLVR